MNALSVAKYALNSQIGTDGFQTLDQLMEQLVQSTNSLINRKTIIQTLNNQEIPSNTDFTIYSGRGELKGLLINSPSSNVSEVSVYLYADGVQILYKYEGLSVSDNGVSYLRFNPAYFGYDFGYIGNNAEPSINPCIPGIRFESGISIKLNKRNFDSFNANIQAIIDTY